jgi:Tfp pilus assembly protein PilF
MATPFMSSEEYDERAHELYNEGQYEDALDILREGLTLYPNSVELHVGVGYARLAREEFAWARRSFEEALVYDPNHEDALAGMGETLLCIGRTDEALRCFNKTLELGYRDDVDLMLQIGRALLKHDSLDPAREYLEIALHEAPGSAEAFACLGYLEHRSGNDRAGVMQLERALRAASDHVEARIYLANLLYDLGEYDQALRHFEKTEPDDHWSELGIWRMIELRRTIRGYDEQDPRLRPWTERLDELSIPADSIDELLSEAEAAFYQANRELDPMGQLELFGTLLSGLADRQAEQDDHLIIDSTGRQYEGSWEEIVRRMHQEDGAEAVRSTEEWMTRQARRVYSSRGIQIPTSDAESFLRGSANAGLLRIVT